MTSFGEPEELSLAVEVVPQGTKAKVVTESRLYRGFVYLVAPCQHSKLAEVTTGGCMRCSTSDDFCERVAIPSTPRSASCLHRHTFPASSLAQGFPADLATVPSS